MKDKELGALVGTGVCGLFAGLLIASGGFKGNFARMFALSGLISTPVVFVAHLLIDTKATNRVNKAESEAQTAKVAASKAESRLSELEESRTRLTSELVKIREVLRVCDSDRQKFSSMVASLTPAIAKLEGELAEARERVEELEADTEAWEEEFDSRVNVEADKRFQEAKRNEIERIFQEHDKITSEAMRLFRQLQGWGHKVAASHQQKRELITSLAQSYNQNIDNLNTSVDKEREQYLQQIEILRERVAQLQHELAGDLLEPQYGKFGYQWDSRIADDLARHIWNTMHIPLAVKGYRSLLDGSGEAGYAFSRSQPIDKLMSDLNRISGEMANALGIHQIIGIRKHELSDLLIIQWRCERPKPLKDDEIYRIIKPSSATLKLIREATDHRKSGKPTLRIMGATGEGKGIIARALLADWVKHESGEVWLSDPVDGSDEDRWECLKVAKSSREARELLKTFKAEFESRKDKVSTRKAIQVLALFDEFDKEHPKEDKELVKGIWTAIRHHKMKLILMGQSSEVGSNGWQWDEMKNCACLFVGSGISTAIKHAKDLGISRVTANQLEIQKDQMMNWLESKNQGLDAGSQYRVALLVVGEKVQFLELPRAYEGVIKNESCSIVSYPWQSLEGEGESKPTISESRICPGCGGKLRKAGSNMKCENSEHTKAMGKKTFPISE